MRLSSLTLVAPIAIVATYSFGAETVHQSLPGTALRTGDGKSAVEQGKAESKKVEGAESGSVTRVKGDMNQWGYVTAWFGVPAPAGKSTVRLRVYVEEAQTAKYMLYIHTEGGQTTIGELKLPADAKPNTFVDVNVPVDAKSEWSGFTIKKAETSTNPSVWIDKLSVVLAG